MRIIQLRNNHVKQLEAECKTCGTRVEASSDSLKWEHDQREHTQLAREKCPNPACNGEIFFYQP